MNTLEIVRRNGEKTTLDTTKIKKVVDWACKGLTVNSIALEGGLTTRLRNGITTKEIQDNLINCALEMCSPEEPDWRYVAGRLHIWSLWKNILVKRGFQYGNYAEVVTTKIQSGEYDSRLKGYTQDELKEAGTWINSDWDMDYDYAGAALLTNRYLLPNELPQEAFLTCALLLALPENEKKRLQIAKKFYESIAKRKISLATPILANLRVPNGSLTSCFIVAMDDNLESIFGEIANTARISKNGGGVGVNVSRIRSTGSWVMDRPNSSGGVIPWIKLLNDTAIAVNQAGRRAGAVTVGLDVWHLDIPEFLEMQTENGDQRRKAYDVFPQVILPDEFMRRVVNKEVWTLVDPYEVKKNLGIDLASLWGDEFEKAYQQIELELGNKITLYKTVSAIDLFKSIMKCQVETGMPYLAFKDTINNANPNQHDGMICQVNLCVAPETKILTDEGYVPIVDLLGQSVNVWNGQEWSNTTVIKTGINQPLIKISFSNGETLECTHYHKFYVQSGYKKIVKVDAKDLKNGDKLIKFSLPIIDNESDIEMDYAYTHGFYCGDGSHDGMGKPEIDLYGQKKELLPYLTVRNKLFGGKHGNTSWRVERDEVAVFDDVNQDRLVLKLPLDIQPKFFVPINGYTLSSRLAWLAGLLDADGTVSRNEDNEALQITSINKQFLLNIRLMLHTMGVESKVALSRSEGKYLLPDQKGGLKEYYCQTVYRLLISSTGLYQLGCLGLQTNRLKWVTRKPQRNAEQFIKITSIEDNGRISDSYCFTELKRNMGMFNGILTGQCVESFSNVTAGITAHCCNLVSLNLANLSLEEIPSYSNIAVRLLDNTIEITTTPITEAKSHNDRYRTIGVGCMGLADWLAKRKLNYSNLRDINQLFEEISYWCTQSSMLLAKERGAYPAFYGSEWSKGNLIGAKPIEWYLDHSITPHRWKTLSENIKLYGIRNSHITAIAPNTSSSLLQGCTASILPVYSRFFYDKGTKGSVPIAPPFIKERFWFYQENKTLNQNTVVKAVATIQQWIDTGISMELLFNLNEGVYFDDPQKTLTAKDMFDTLLLAWQSGCKAVYYVRSIQKDMIKNECISCAN